MGHIARIVVCLIELATYRHYLLLRLGLGIQGSSLYAVHSMDASKGLLCSNPVSAFFMTCYSFRDLVCAIKGRY